MLQRAQRELHDGNRARASELATRAGRELSEQGIDSHARVAALVVAAATGDAQRRSEQERLREHLRVQS